MHYRGHRLYLRVSGKGAEVSADPRDVPPIEIECHGRVERLSWETRFVSPDRSRVEVDT